MIYSAASTEVTIDIRRRPLLSPVENLNEGNGFILDTDGVIPREPDLFHVDGSLIRRGRVGMQPFIVAEAKRLNLVIKLG